MVEESTRRDVPDSPILSLKLTSDLLTPCVKLLIDVFVPKFPQMVAECMFKHFIKIFFPKLVLSKNLFEPINKHLLISGNNFFLAYKNNIKT